MRTGHRIGIVVTAVVGIVAVVGVSPAAASGTRTAAEPNTQHAQNTAHAQNKKAKAAPKKGPRPVSQVLSAVDAGESAWVRVRWKTDRRVCDVQVVVWGDDDVVIDYPGEREFTSFSRGDSLGLGRADYTSFRVEANPDGNDFSLLAATISYTDCKRGSPLLTHTSGLMLPARS
ncbi:hypothetical protein [Actinoplanes solisilvae]|uniref:hypothetical protein n=1 Tax=Actinoplanes solisilvae TaxID=2486853 RepID=UPI000FDC0E67|nr:hypothetical protein [Actinoplanes solisilvae]